MSFIIFITTTYLKYHTQSIRKVRQRKELKKEFWTFEKYLPLPNS